MICHESAVLTLLIISPPKLIPIVPIIKSIMDNLRFGIIMKFLGIRYLINFFQSSCFSLSVILVHSTISSNVLPHPSQMLVEVFKAQFFVQGLIDTDDTLWGFFRSLHLQPPRYDSPCDKKTNQKPDLNSNDDLDRFCIPSLYTDMCEVIDVFHFPKLVGLLILWMI